jgi:type I restriction enzyme R subunit
MSEANARIIIDRLLRESDWVLSGDDGVVNVDTEMQNQAGFADYVLKDRSDFPLCIIEAKKQLISPLVGKEQARGYAESLNCRFVILSNGVSHYFWDIKQGSPTVVDIFPTQEQLELRKTNFNPPRQEVEEIGVDYIAQTQLPKFDQNPDYLDERKREDFLRRNKLRLLRDY